MAFSGKPSYAHKRPVSFNAYAYDDILKRALAVLVKMMPYIACGNAYLRNHPPTSSNFAAQNLILSPVINGTKDLKH